MPWAGVYMRIHQLSPLEAVASLNSSVDGLSRAEVARRLHEYGRNRVEEVARRDLCGCASSGNLSLSFR